MRIGRLVGSAGLVAVGACTVTFTHYPGGLSGSGGTDTGGGPGATTSGTVASTGTGGAATSTGTGGTLASTGTSSSSSGTGTSSSSSSSGTGMPSACDGGAPVCPAGSTCSVSGCSDWADWLMPNAPDAGLPRPLDAGLPPAVESYTPSVARGYVLDDVTHLWWQEPLDAPNSATPPASCAGGCTQADAIAYCQSLELQSVTWRLPTRIELVSIVDTTASHPAIDETAFPGAPPSGFWTSSSYAPTAGDGWVIDFSDGSTNAQVAGALNRVRCVH